MPSVLNSTESGSRPAGAPATAAAVTVLPPRSHDRRDRQASPPEPGRPAALTGAGLAVVLVGVLLPMVDFFIVNVALPTIDRDLHASAPLLELVVSAYASAYALLLVVGGRLGDSFGRKRLFLVGMAAFTLTSLACGLAPTAIGPGHRQGRAGRLGGHDGPAGPVHHPGHHHRRAPGPGAGPLRRGRRHRRRGRPAARRPARLGQHRRPRLAADLPGQRARRASSG